MTDGPPVRPSALQIAQYLLGSRHVAEEHAVAQAVERHPQRREPFRRAAVDAGDAEPLGQTVLRGELVPLPAHGVVVRQVGPALAGAPGLDVIGEQPREPKAVIAEMHAHQQSPLPGVVQPGEVLHDVDEIAVALVVGPTDAGVPVVIAELEQQRGQVVRELTVVDGRGAQGVSYRHVREQGRRRDGERAHRQQRLEQTGLVEQRVGTLLEQLLLVARAPPPGASASAPSRKSCIRRRPRTLARIMPKPPSRAATPRPGVELLGRLTMLAQELAGAFRPASVMDLGARALAELLRPGRLSVVLLDAESNRLAVTYDTNAAPARTDDPLLQLALRRGPLAFPRDVREEARRRRAELDRSEEHTSA